MSTISVANTDSGLSGKTLVNAEDTQTITGAKTFSRNPNPPFAVVAGSANVPNLDADKVDGHDAAEFLFLTGGTMVGDLKFTDATYDIGKSGATRPRDGFFSRNVTVGGTLTPSGSVDISGASAGQVVFPASQNASAGVNTLDDYEEGSWTPVIGGDGGTSGQTYSSQVGRYVKVGKQVTAWFNVTLTAKGTITANVIISGLPFTADNVSNLNPIGSVVWINLATNWVSVAAVVITNTTTAALRGANAAAATNNTALATADIANNTQLLGTITYQASA